MSKRVCVKKKVLQILGFNDLADWLRDERNVYIGGKCTYVAGANYNRWSCPYNIRCLGGNKMMTKYREYLLNKPNLIAELKNLVGKTLGCWCGVVDKCHGDVLIKLVGELSEKNE